MAYLASSDAADLGRAVRELFVAGAEGSPAALAALVPAAGVAALWSPSNPPSPGIPFPVGAPAGSSFSAAAAAASRALLTSELTKLCVRTACEAGGETGERLCSALAQLTLTGQLSPGGSAHALRVLAARLSQLRQDFPGALKMLAAFTAWLAECGAVPEDALEARGVAADAAFAEAARSLGWAVGGGGGVVHSPPPAGAMGCDALEVAAAVRQLLRSREPSQLSQVRAMYDEALTAYLRSGGAGFSSTVRTLAEMGAWWTRNELARSLLRAFLSPPWAHVGALQLEGGPGSDVEEGGGSGGGEGSGALAGGGAGGSGAGAAPASSSSEARDHAAFAADMPIWAVHELCVGLLLELHARGLVDSLAVAAAAEATLRDLPELALDVEDAPGLFGAALLKLCAEGALGEGWLEGKHASLGGLTLAGAVAARSAARAAAAPSPPTDPSGVSTPAPASSPLAPPAAAARTTVALPNPSPALGPLPSNTWAGHVSATRAGSTAASSASPPHAWVAVANFAAAGAPPPELPPLELTPPAAGEPAPPAAGGGSGVYSPARSAMPSSSLSPRAARSPAGSFALALKAPFDVWGARAPALLALALAAAGLHGDGGAGGGELGLREVISRLKRLGLLGGGGSAARGSALTVGELCAAARCAGEALGAAAARPGGGSSTLGLQSFSTALLGLGGDWSRLMANEAVRASVWRAAAVAGAGEGAPGAGHRLALALAGLHRRGVLRARCIRLGIARACEGVALPQLARDGTLKMAPSGERAAAAALLPHVIATLAALNRGAAIGGRPFFPGALPEVLAGELDSDAEEEGGGEGGGALARVAKETVALTVEKEGEAGGLLVP